MDSGGWLRPEAPSLLRVFFLVFAQRQVLDDFLTRRRAEIRRLVAQYGVPHIERLGEFTFLRGLLPPPRKGS